MSLRRSPGNVVVAYNLYDGISDQVACNSNPIEVQSLGWWLAIWVFTPNNWEYSAVWHVAWLGFGGGTDVRREAFEDGYQFTTGQRWNPLTQEFNDVTIIGASEYFTWLADFNLPEDGDCGPLLYPSW